MFFQVPLAVEQNNCLTKFVNVYIVYDLELWPNVSLGHFAIKYRLFGVTNIVKNGDKEKYVYSGIRIASDRKVKWSFGNDFARNVIVFDVDNSSSSYADNLKNNF